MSNNEKMTGPLRIQGDHGAVAFWNISITKFDTAVRRKKLRMATIQQTPYS